MPRTLSITCPCGQTFTTSEARLSAGRGRYCSKRCMYRYRIRPKGLKYKVVRENPAWLKPGHAPNATSFRPGQQHPQWSGNDVGYCGLHRRVRKLRGRAADYPCSHADKTCCGAMQWANVSGEYRGVDDFMPLCRSHHRRYDNGGGGR